MIKKKYYSISPPLKASLWFAICTFIQKVITTITTPIFTRILTTSEYGEFSVFTSWLGIVSVFVTLNLFSGVFMQGMIKFQDSSDTFSASLQGLTTTLTLIWTIIYLCFQQFWNDIFSLTTTQMLFMLILVWSTAIFNFWASEQRIKLKYKSFVLVTILFATLRPVFGVVFVLYSDDKVTARIFSMVIINIILYCFPFFIKMYKTKVFFSGKFWRYALWFNIPLIPHYLSSTLLNSADRIMIDSIIGSEAAGIYSLAYSLSTLLIVFNSAVMQTVEPWIYKKIKNKELDAISNLSYPLFVAIAVINLFLIAFAPELVYVFAPHEYHDAIWIIPPVTMSVLFMFAYTFFAAFEFYYEKRINIMISTTLAAILNILLNLIFINMFGYYAAGYTTLFCYAAYAVFHYFSMKKVCKKYLDNYEIYNIKILLATVFSFLLLGFLFMVTYHYIFLRIILFSLMLLALYMLRNKILKLIITIKNIKNNKEV